MKKLNQRKEKSKMLKKHSKDKAKKKVLKFLEDLEWMFDYNNYEKSIVFKEEDKDEIACEVVEDWDYRRITIKVFPTFFTHSLKDQRKFLLHELCHSYSNKIYQQLHEIINHGKFISWNSVKQNNEECTSRITETISRLLEGNLRYAKRAYSDYLK